jgi:prepilin-type N-terminal cleavage/methylation domain-containing protein
VSHVRAFSLIEVMAAAAIFGVGLAATFSAFAGGANLFEHQRHTTHGIHLTEGKLEELLIRSATDAELQAGVRFGPQWFDARGFPAPSTAVCPTTTTGLPSALPNCRYRVTWRTAPGGVANVRIVTVETAWNERGTTRSISFSTQRN